jgi:hypothetical protein
LIHRSAVGADLFSGLAAVLVFRHGALTALLPVMFHVVFLIGPFYG